MPVTTLRAGIVIGHGGISWEMTRQLVEHLPAMITPRWVHTRTQPIAVADVVRYLVGVLDVPEAAGRAFDIGGPDVLEYLEMLRRVAAIEGRKLIVVPVPLLSPRLSSRWLSLVTSVDVQTGRSLIDSMTNEVVVRDDSIRRLVPFEPMDYDSAVLQALGERARPSAPPGGRGEAADRRDRACASALPPLITERVPRDPQETPDSVPAAAPGGRRHRAGRGRAARGVAVHPPGLAGVLRADPGHRRHLDAGRAGVGAAAPRPDAAAGTGSRRPTVVPVLTGVGRLRRCSTAARWSSQRIPVLNRAITSVLRYAEHGSGPLVLATTLANGAAEEVFFRGALYAAIESRRPVLTSTAVYMLATAATRNPALVLASGGDGHPVRRCSGAPRAASRRRCSPT